MPVAKIVNGKIRTHVTHDHQPVNDLIRTVVDFSAKRCHAMAWALDFDAHGEPNVSILEDQRALPSRPPLPGELYLWFGKPASNSWQMLLPYLHEVERQQILRLLQAADRWSFAAARTGLRLMLSTALSCKPHEIAFHRAASGKLSLDHTRHGDHAHRVHFSISHTRGLVAVALAGRPVGVDVEEVRVLEDIQAVARKAFADESLSALAKLESDAERTALFYRLWTLGEAFAKATGEGLGLGLKTFQFNTSGAPILIRVDESWGPPARWRFCVFPR